MNKTLVLSLIFLFLAIGNEARKTSKSKNSGSGRGASRKSYSPKPAPPTSFSYPQASAPKPSLFGWQEKPAQRTQNAPRQSQTSSGSGHSYPSSNTGLSGSNTQPKQPPTYQDSVQRSNAPSNSHNQPGHSYPSSSGLSGSPGSGVGYPQQTGSHAYPGAAPPSYPGSGPGGSSNGLSGAGTGYQQQPGSHTYTGAAPSSYSIPGNTNHQYNGGGYPTNNFGSNSYQHPQGPPPPYTNTAAHYGGYGGHGPYNTGYGPQMPGYFGNAVNYGKGFGGPSRTSNALKGVGIAGAGVGTLLTGLALWNLARSTGQHHHTVVYDNRGQPVAVAPANSTSPAADSMLADLVNCTLTISSENATEVLAIPCSIATSFSPDADVKVTGQDDKPEDKTKCTVTVITKTGREYMTTISCSILLNSAAENNVTEPPVVFNETLNADGTAIPSDEMAGSNQQLMLSDADKLAYNSKLECSRPEPGDIRDPINPCFAVTHNLTVIPLEETSLTTASSA